LALLGSVERRRRPCACLNNPPRPHVRAALHSSTALLFHLIYRRRQRRRTHTRVLRTAASARRPQTTMFRDFSFDAASPPSFSAYEADRAAMNVSPTSKPEPRQPFLGRPPTPPCTMGDLASKLNQQSLRIDTCLAKHHGSGPLTPPSDDDCSILPDHASPRPTYCRISASLLRMQRQSSSRMQCSSSHMRDISRLVHMIQQEEQCTISQATSRTCSASTSSSSSTTLGDEGIDMEYDMPSPGIEALVGTPQWRSSDLRDNCTRVAKPVRMRKRSGHKVEKRRAS
jgi:hypothetical protein